jgi:hypothetical protein
LDYREIRLSAEEEEEEEERSQRELAEAEG